MRLVEICLVLLDETLILLRQANLLSVADGKIKYFRMVQFQNILLYDDDKKMS